MSATETSTVVDDRPRFSGPWETKRLGEVAELFGGGTPSTSMTHYWGSDVPWCTPTDLTANPHKYQRHTDRCISLDGLRSSSARLLPTGTLLLCTRATIGEIRIAGIQMSTNQGFQSLVCGRHTYNEFLYYKLLTLKDVLLSLGVGSTFLEVSRSSVAAVRAALPPLPEQRAIAAALSDVDDLLQSLDRLIAKKRDIKQGTMQELLTGRTRLPGFSGKWETKRLGEVCKTLSGGTPRLSDSSLWGGDIPWISPKDMKTTELKSSIDTVTRAAVGNGTRLIPEETILLVTRGMILAHSLPVAITSKPMTFNQDVRALSPLPGLAPRFLLYWFAAKTSEVRSLITASTHGTMRLPTEDLLSIDIQSPPLPEQRAIAAVLSDMDAEIDALEARRKKVAAIKQGMMQELLTGRTRLPIPQEQSA